MKEFLMLIFFLLAAYGLFSAITDLIVWSSPRRMRQLAYRLMNAAGEKEKQIF